MVNEKNKLIKELIIDVIFTLGLIGLTIINERKYEYYEGSNR